MRKLLKKRFWFGIWLGLVRPLQRWWRRLNEQTHDLPNLLFHHFDRFTSYGPHEAAALSYYALFSFFPLLLLAIVIGASLLGSAAASDQIRDTLELFLPGDAAIVLQDAVEAATENRGSVSIFAVIILSWSSANLFGNLEKVLVQAFGFQSKRRIYERRAIGIILIIILGIFLIGSILTNFVFNLLDLIFLTSFTPWLQITSLVVPTGFNAAIFALLYGFSPKVHLRWDAIWPAALLAGAAFEVAKRAFVFYLTNLTELNYVYGSVTAVIVFLLWAFVSFCLLILGAEICAALDEWMRNVDEKTPQVTEDDLFMQETRSTFSWLNTPNNDLP